MVVAEIIPIHCWCWFRLPMDITLTSSYCSLDDSKPGMLPLKIQPLLTRLPHQHVVKSSESGISLNVVRNFHSPHVNLAPYILHRAVRKTPVINQKTDYVDQIINILALCLEGRRFAC